MTNQVDDLPDDPAELAEFVLGPSIGFRQDSEPARLARRVPNADRIGFHFVDDDSEEEK